MKKTISIILSLAMLFSLCTCMTIISFASGETITAEVQGSYTQKAEEQDITIRISVNGLAESYCVFGIDGGMTLPDGFTIKSWSTSNTVQPVVDGDYNKENGKLAYMTNDVDDTIPAETSYDVVLSAPANAVGNYSIDFNNIAISKTYGQVNIISVDKVTANLTIAAPAAEGYTVALSTDAASEGVTQGDTFNLKLDVTNSDSEIQDFSAFYATLKYDPTLVSFEGDTASQSDVNQFNYNNDSTAGTLKITRVGDKVNFTDDPELTLPFKANAAGDASFDFQGDVLVSAQNKAESDADKAAVTGTPLTVTINENVPVTVVNSNGDSDANQPAFIGSGEQTIYQKIDATIQNGEGCIPTYDGQPMYQVEGYDADHYYYVFPADETYSAEKLSYTEGTATTIAKTFDVNETNVTDINDAQYVYNIYNGIQTPSTNAVMRLIKADTDRNQSINMSDCAAVIAGL